MHGQPHIKCWRNFEYFKIFYNNSNCIYKWYICARWIIKCIKPLNAQLNPICHLLALLEAHHILHVSRIRVKHRLLYPFLRIQLFFLLICPSLSSANFFLSMRENRYTDRMKHRSTAILWGSSLRLRQIARHSRYLSHVMVHTNASYKPSFHLFSTWLSFLYVFACIYIFFFRCRVEDQRQITEEGERNRMLQRLAK